MGSWRFPLIRLALVLGVVVALAGVGVRAQDEAAAVPVAESAAAAEELSMADFAIEPMANESAALDADGAAEVAAISTDEAAVVPPSLVIAVGLGIVFDDNIFLSPVDQESDFVAQAVAGLTWTPRQTEKSGLRLQYEAVGFKYIDHSELDPSIDHFLSLDSHLQVGRTRLSLAGSYRRMSGSNYDLDSPGQYNQIGDFQTPEGDRNADPFVERDVIGVEALAVVELAGKTSMNIGARYSANLYQESLQSSQDISGRVGFGYLVGGKTTVGVSGVLGRLENDNSATQTYEQALLTLSYDATGKLRFSGSAGADFRQSDGTGAQDTTDFVYNLNGHYQWRDKTALTLTGSRSTIGSATVTGSTIQRTLISFGVEQKIGDKMVASLRTGYDFSDYQEETEIGESREDSFWLARISLTYAPNSHTTLGFYYDFRDNNSSEAFQSYRSNRVGMRLGFSF